MGCLSTKPGCPDSSRKNRQHRLGSASKCSLAALICDFLSGKHVSGLAHKTIRIDKLQTNLAPAHSTFSSAVAVAPLTRSLARIVRIPGLSLTANGRSFEAAPRVTDRHRLPAHHRPGRAEKAASHRRLRRFSGYLNRRPICEDAERRRREARRHENGHPQLWRSGRLVESVGQAGPQDLVGHTTPHDRLGFRRRRGIGCARQPGPSGLRTSAARPFPGSPAS
jgi:hypothetical protein